MIYSISGRAEEKETFIHVLLEGIQVDIALEEDILAFSVQDTSARAL